MPGTVRVGLVVLSTLLSAASTVPYLVATAKRQTRPRVVTWLTWALLTAVGGAASASVGDYPSAAFSFIGTVVTSAVVVAGLRYGDRTFGRLDSRVSSSWWSDSACGCCSTCRGSPLAPRV